ncbi:MAG: hypothetical protein H6695_02280 [Deferribacteres bacterium]|nr:hypothetical protein [Deferribacteres bacterium]
MYESFNSVNCDDCQNWEVGSVSWFALVCASSDSQQSSYSSGGSELFDGRRLCFDFISQFFHNFRHNVFYPLVGRMLAEVLVRQVNDRA